MDKDRVLNELSRRWVREPLVANGFQAMKQRLWVSRNPISTVVRLWTQRDPDALKFTLEWGFFSPAFAQAMSWPHTLTSALRAPIGWLLGDGRFDVWWAIRGDGVFRQAGNEIRLINHESDTELRTAIADRLLPISRSVRTVTDLVDRFWELSRSFQTGLADKERTLNLIRGEYDETKLNRAAQEHGARLLNAVTDRLSLVEVEPVEGRRHQFLITFSDVIAHNHADLVEQCLRHSTEFPGVDRAEWEDREVIIVWGEEIDAPQLQTELYRLVSGHLAEREG
jgi:hypothetical protein